MFNWKKVINNQYLLSSVKLMKEACQIDLITPRVVFYNDTFCVLLGNENGAVICSILGNKMIIACNGRTSLTLLCLTVKEVIGLLRRFPK